MIVILVYLCPTTAIDSAQTLITLLFRFGHYLYDY